MNLGRLLLVPSEKIVENQFENLFQHVFCNAVYLDSGSVIFGLGREKFIRTFYRLPSTEVADWSELPQAIQQDLNRAIGNNAPSYREEEDIPAGFSEGISIPTKFKRDLEDKLADIFRLKRSLLDIFIGGIRNLNENCFYATISVSGRRVQCGLSKFQENKIEGYSVKLMYAD